MGCNKNIFNENAKIELQSRYIYNGSQIGDWYWITGTMISSE